MLSVNRILELLDRRQYAEALIQMERTVLDGCCLDAALIERLPAEHLERSPILMRELGRWSLLNGRLSEAKLRLERAVKEYGGMADSDGLLSAMSLLARVQLRLGELEDANALFVFLQEEMDRGRIAPDSIRGEVAFTLAEASLAARDSKKAKERFLYAIDRFERSMQDGEARAALAELLFIGHDMPLSSEEWEQLVWRLSRWNNRCGGFADVPDWLPALRDAQLEKWQAVYDRLCPIMESSALRSDESYRSRAYVRLIFAKAARTLQPEFIREQLGHLETIHDSYKEDLPLTRACLLAIAEVHSSMGETELAHQANREAAYITRYIYLQHSTAVLPPSEAPATANLISGDTSAAPAWRVSLFGGFAFHRDGQEVRQIRWKRRKAMELCIFLLLQPKYTYSKEALMELLELGEDADKAGNTLYVIIHQLKTVLAEHLGIRDGVYIQNGLVTLHDSAFDFVDAERYESLVRVADRLWQHDRELSNEMYQEAFDLYDELVPELPYASWLTEIREHFHEKQLSVIRKLRMLAEEQQDVILEESYCKEWIRLQPDHEEPYARYIHFLLRMKRNAEAKSIFNSYSAKIRDELGVEPSDELIADLRRNGIETSA